MRDNGTWCVKVLLRVIGGVTLEVRHAICRPWFYSSLVLGFDETMRHELNNKPIRLLKDTKRKKKEKKKRPATRTLANNIVPLEWNGSTLEVGSASIPYIFSTMKFHSAPHHASHSNKLGKRLQADAGRGFETGKEER